MEAGGGGVRHYTPQQSTYVSGTDTTPEQRAVFVKEVAVQVERLLWLAYHLQLGPLINHLHSFIRYNVTFLGALLRGRLSLVFTHRVLEAALGRNQLGAPAWITSVITESAGMVKGCPFRSALFQTARTQPAQSTPSIDCPAVLQRDFMGLTAGTKVDLQVDLLQSGQVKVMQGGHSARLCIGPDVLTPEDFDRMMYSAL